MRHLVFSLLSALLLAGCAAIPSPQERQTHADTLAASKGWQANRIAAGRFDLVAYAPPTVSAGEQLTIYIEGDGFAWVTGSQPSADPTPRDPLALRLALAHSAGNAVYLARPCQYVDAARIGCAQRYWTEARFAAETIDSANLAIDTLKRRFGATKLVLVGYSGGGAVAALLAERRSDVARLITVAGNLDHRAWTAHHHVQPLVASLNAADAAQQLAGLPQTHFIGSKDKVVPPELARAWPRAFAGPRGSNLRIIPGADHTCCWAERWADLFPQD